MALHEAAYLDHAGAMRNLKPLNQAWKPPLHWFADASSDIVSLLEFHVVPANCESFPHLILDRIGRRRGSVCATSHCFGVIFRLELTEPAGIRRALQPSALSECRKINSGWGIPSTRAIAGAKL
jgi:hypothetical protein